MTSAAGGHSPRLVIISADGATLPHARTLIDRAAAASGRAPLPVRALRSVYPSSTAPAHASMLTGATPGAHGIVGNRYWEDEPVATIRRRQEPLDALHPYEHPSLRVSSLIDDLRRHGRRVAAIMFPHTFDLDAADQLGDVLFCLYAPTERRTIPMEGGNLPIRALGFDVDLAVRVDRGGREATLIERSSGATWSVSPSRPADVVLRRDGARLLSFRVTALTTGQDEVELTRTTAVTVIPFGDARNLQIVTRPGLLPHSAGPRYVAGGDLDFHESPSAEWVTAAALELIERCRPDVLLIRYNQIDHAQERLTWHAKHGAPAAREEARREIAETYRDVGGQVGEIVATLHPGVPVLVFSDHGIDDVSSQVAPNAALCALGMDGQFVFQGDSNCAYLYGDRDLLPSERSALMDHLVRHSGSVTQVSAAQLSTMGAYAPARSGRLALRSDRHVTFDYGDSVLTRPVRIGAHGFDPALPEMHGIVSGFGRWDPVPAPGSLLELRDIALSALGLTNGRPR